MAKQRGHAVLVFLFAFVAMLVAAGNGCGSDVEDNGGANSADGGDGSSGSSGTSGTSGGSSGFATSSSGTSGTSSGTTSSGSSGNNCVAPQAVVLSPATKSQNVTPGTPFTQAYTAMADGKDVTAQTQFTTSDANVGTFTGATFTWANKFGGSLTIKGMYCGVVGTAALNLKLIAAPFTAGTGTSTLATDFSTAPASTNNACKPILKYPPDQILLPPNTNVIEVHFLGSGNNKFEISFTNDATDVRVYTTCTAGLVNGQPDVANGAVAPGVTGGCLFELNQAEWDLIANSNRDGNPLTVGVRGLGCDGGNAAASDTRTISFAKQDIVGTIYYWASIRPDAQATTFTGGVYRYDYGKRAQTAQAVLVPDTASSTGSKYYQAGAPTKQQTNGLCIGCHVVDREGRKMIFDFDDLNGDDEYGDMWTAVFDIPSRTSTSLIEKGSVNSFSAGFSTWNRAASRFLKSDGWGNGLAGANPTEFDGPRGTFHVISNVGQPVGNTSSGLLMLRGSTPDIAPNDNQVVFAAAWDDGLPQATHKPPQAGEHITGGPTTPGYFGSSAHPDVAPDGLTDEYFSGAGLYIAKWDTTANKMSEAKPIFPAAASTSTSPPNYYYPAFSPDGSMIVFNYAASGANFYNPKARVQLVTADGTVAADQHRANETNPVENGGELTNSWVRWTPFIQEYKGKRLAWVTFSSTRNYGLRLDNTGGIDCQPLENPNTTVYPVFTDTKNNNCARAQLWMAAIDLDTGKVATGGDVSFPAFWLPFQDINTQNHLGQWTQKNLDGTCSGDAGTCPTGRVCDNGACASIPPPSTNPPSQAQCSQDIQCPTGNCCASGVCGACTGTSAPAPCNTCLDCDGQSCNGAAGCGGCTTSADCCAPLVCSAGKCIDSVK